MWVSWVTEIVNTWPPNIDAIRAVLPVTRDNIFAYDGKIYSPVAYILEPTLIAHERVHFAQQESIGVDAWWDRFLKSKKFRLSQEIPAHQAEWRAFLSLNPGRKQRRAHLKMMAKRLSAPMYGRLISTSEAKKVICACPEQS